MVTVEGGHQANLSSLLRMSLSVLHTDLPPPIVFNFRWMHNCLAESRRGNYASVLSVLFFCALLGGRLKTAACARASWRPQFRRLPQQSQDWRLPLPSRRGFTAGSSQVLRGAGRTRVR